MHRRVRVRSFSRMKVNTRVLVLTSYPLLSPLGDFTATFVEQGQY